MSSPAPSKKPMLSTILKKVLMALSGLGLIAYIVLHLLGNLSLFNPDGRPFNLYANQLQQFGGLLIVAEIGLFMVFAIHIAVAITLKIKDYRARPQLYASTSSRATRSKGKPSRQSAASLNMLFAGMVLLGFLIIHVKQFRFGPGVAEGYVSQVLPGQVRDLYRLVNEVFEKPIYVLLYSMAMVFLGLHLRHGIWSVFQSLGIANAKALNVLHRVALVLSIVIAGGFLLIPLWFYFDIHSVILRWSPPASYAPPAAVTHAQPPTQTGSP